MGLTFEQIAVAVIGAVVGGGGLTGLLFRYLSRYIDRKLETAEAEEAEKQKMRLRRRQIDDKIGYAQGRVFFWIIKALHDQSEPPPMEELDKAFAELQEAEERGKDLDREIIARAQEE